jgi:putative copper export protein
LAADEEASMPARDHSLRDLIPFARSPDPGPDAGPATLRPVHWLAAGVLALAGAEAAIGRRRGRRPDEVRTAPLLAAPLAALGHAARAAGGDDHRFRTAARLLDGFAIGVGAIGTLSSVVAAARDGGGSAPRPGGGSVVRRIPSLAPLTLAAAGLLGVLLDREERRAAAAAAPQRMRRRRRRIRVIVHV